MKNFEEINRTFTVKKTKFLQRVLWLMIPLLTIFTTNVWGEDYFSDTFSNVGNNNSSTVSSRTGWSGLTKCYAHFNSAIRLGTSSATGSITKTAMTGIGSTPTNIVVRFSAKRWNTDNVGLSITVNNAGSANVTSIALGTQATTDAAVSWNEKDYYEIIITGATSSTTITFTTSAGKRLLLGNVTISSASDETYIYKLVENAGDISAGDYLIVYNNTNALNTHYGNPDANTYGTYTDISSYYTAATKSIASNATTDALVYKAYSTTNGYALRRAYAGELLGTTSSSTGAYLRWDRTFTTSQNEWTLGVNSIVSVYASANAIRWNTGSPRFAMYGKTNESAVQLFKKVEAPSCDAPTAVTKGSFNRTNQKMEIGWTGATNVDICYSKSTTKPASPQVTNTSTNPYAIDVSDYSATDKCYVWVRQNCGGGETSAWVAINVSGNAYFNLPSHTLAITPSPASSGSFSPTSGQTVVEGRTVSITATPAAGYVFSSWAVSGANASISSTSANPTTFTMGTANATVTATFTAKPLVSISLSPASGTVYVGQYADFTVAYDPSDYLSKGYTLVATPTYVTKIAQAPAQTLLRLQGGRSSGPGSSITTDQTETISIQASADNTKTASVSITVKPLPKVHFVDIVHGYEFADVVGTIEGNALVANKTTPTHAEFSGSGGANACENEHTRLVGWILSTWAEANPDATHEAIIDAGTGVFIEANAAINVLTYNGNTYYAVWAKLQ